MHSLQFHCETCPQFTWSSLFWHPKSLNGFTEANVFSCQNVSGCCFAGCPLMLLSGKWLHYHIARVASVTPAKSKIILEEGASYFIFDERLHRLKLFLLWNNQGTIQNKTKKVNRVNLYIRFEKKNSINCSPVDPLQWMGAIRMRV